MHRRGNYSSGEDFVLEYGELRFTFNETWCMKMSSCERDRSLAAHRFILFICQDLREFVENGHDGGRRTTGTTTHIHEAQYAIRIS